MSSISDGTTSVSVLMILGWDDSEPAGNIRHDIIGKAEPDFTLHPTGTREGTIRAVTETMAAGWSLRTLLKQPKVFTVVNTDLPGASMDFVLSEGGRVRVELDEVTRLRGVVSIDFTEVS